MNPTPSTPWPEDLRRVFAALATAMAEKPLTPQTLHRLPTTQGSILPNHAVSVTHTPGTSRRQRGHHTITTTGPRTDGRWHLRPSQLQALSQQASKPAM